MSWFEFYFETVAEMRNGLNTGDQQGTIPAHLADAIKCRAKKQPDAMNRKLLHAAHETILIYACTNVKKQTI
jgi:hypothetical protein